MRALVFAVLVLVLPGCATRERVTIVIEPHQLSVEVPKGWRHLDLGKRHVLQNGEDEIAFEVLGPADREGIRREVARARELARAGRLLTAQAVLANIRVSDDLFEASAKREAFWEVWSRVSQAEENTPGYAVDDAFARLLEAVETLPDRDPRVIEREALEAMGADDRRDVASRTRMDVGGRNMLVVDTWYRMTHEKDGRHAILVEDGLTLGIWTARGAYRVTVPVFDQVLRSLRFESAPADSAVA